MTKHDHSFDNDKQAVDITCNSYKIYPSILNLRNAITAKETTNDNTIFSPLNSNEVRQSLQKPNPSKTIGQDNLPTGLAKMADESLSTPLSIAINNR